MQALLRPFLRICRIAFFSQLPLQRTVRCASCSLSDEAGPLQFTVGLFQHLLEFRLPSGSVHQQGQLDVLDLTEAERSQSLWDLWCKKCIKSIKADASCELRFNLWAVLMAPMLLGADIRHLTAFDLDLWQHGDPLGCLERNSMYRTWKRTWKTTLEFELVDFFCPWRTEETYSNDKVLQALRGSAIPDAHIGTRIGSGQPGLFGDSGRPTVQSRRRSQRVLPVLPAIVTSRSRTHETNGY